MAVKSAVPLPSAKLTFFQIATTSHYGYDADTMTQMDWEKERQRLAARYADMSHGELQRIAVGFPSLTEVAKVALDSEMSKRALPSPAQIAADYATEIAESEARKPTLLRRFRDLPEASIAKSVLDSAGIECFLADDNMVRLDWFYSNLVGGIKLLVPANDAQAAAKLLDENSPVKFDVEGVGEYEQPRCPRCGSMDISLDGLDKPLTFGAMWITSLPIPVTPKGWKCQMCGNEWSEEPIQSPGSTPGEQPQ
jgi:hypothetical protein